MMVLGAFILTQYFTSGLNRDLAFGLGGLILGALMFFMRRRRIKKMD